MAKKPAMVDLEELYTPSETPLRSSWKKLKFLAMWALALIGVPLSLVALFAGYQIYRLLKSRITSFFLCLLIIGLLVWGFLGVHKLILENIFLLYQLPLTVIAIAVFGMLIMPIILGFYCVWCGIFLNWIDPLADKGRKY